MKEKAKILINQIRHTKEGITTHSADIKVVKKIHSMNNFISINSVNDKKWVFSRKTKLSGIEKQKKTHQSSGWEERHRITYQQS